MSLRLRQMVLIARNLAPVIDDLREVFGLEVAFRLEPESRCLTAAPTRCVAASQCVPASQEAADPLPLRLPPRQARYDSLPP